MTFFLDMATGAELTLDAPNCQRADAVKAYHPGQIREQDQLALRLAAVEPAPVTGRATLPPGTDIGALLRSMQD